MDDDDDYAEDTDKADEAETFADEMAAMRRKMARIWGRLILRNMRDLSRRWPQPRLSRLPAQARALRSVVREAQAAGLVPTPERGGSGRAPKRRRAR
jgi:hypothetical protein